MRGCSVQKLGGSPNSSTSLLKSKTARSQEIPASRTRQTHQTSIAILGIDEFPAEKQKEFAELARTFSLWMLFFDAPEHTRLRKLMNKGFSPAAIESLRPQIEKIVDRLLIPLRKNHRMDILPQFAHPLPAYVIAEIPSHVARVWK